MGTTKMKDNVKARKDVKKYCNQVELHIRQVGTKDMKPKASYTLTKPQVGKICAWLTHLKFSDGYASNLGGCVSLEDQTFYSFKSHECHVFMQRLLPIALRGMIPNSIWDVITELSTFFRAIYARVLHTSDLILLQQSIVEIICKLEKIVPPGFFDSMEHLSGRRRSLSDEEMRMAHNYIILNCEELHPFIGLFDDFVRHTQPQLDEKGLENYRDKNFAEWLEQHVCESFDDSLSHLKGLARGPLCHAWSYKGYFINGACYNETECNFYGLLEEVIEVAYNGVGRCVVILFKCKWFDAARGVRIDNKHNIVDIKYKSRLINDEPFVLASQVEQVYYTPYPLMTKDLKDWWVVVKTKSKSMYELEECENEEDVGDNADKDEFFQESETLIPTTSRSSSEIEEPICLVIQGELELVNNNGDETQTELSDEAEQSDEVEFLDNSDESDDDSDDIFDDSSDNDHAGLGTMWLGILPFGKFLFKLLVEEMDHLDAQERKQHKSGLENPKDFEEEILDAKVQQNEAIPLSEEEIALDVASSEGTMSSSGGEEVDYDMTNYGYDDYE
ncbi:transposase, Ptta/En/Spm [Tanacetum coccineum]